MYNDEWEPVMTADSMEEKIDAFAELARKRSGKQDTAIEDIVHEMTHESYLLKHTTDDVLKELQDLQAVYPDAFYDGTANDHIMSYLDDPPEFEFWYDYAFLSLAAGLEWAVLETLDETTARA